MLGRWMNEIEQIHFAAKKVKTSMRKCEDEH